MSEMARPRWEKYSGIFSRAFCIALTIMLWTGCWNPEAYHTTSKAHRHPRCVQCQFAWRLFASRPYDKIPLGVRTHGMPVVRAR